MSVSLRRDAARAFSGNTLRALDRLDDRLLRDIGVSPDVVRTPLPHVTGDLAASFGFSGWSRRR